MPVNPSPLDSDADLWSLVCNDDIAAFRHVVERHQSAVSAVAFAVCGEFAASEDAAQEAFLTAWRERTSLQEPSRLRAWLCGIGRNIARNIRRRQVRNTRDPLDVSLLEASQPTPEEAAVTREEETLVWNNLEQIPEAYREPLVLFYRESQSVSEVAEALDLSEDAVRQRLSRGRALLREQVMSVVEGALTRSRPKGTFTTSVLAGVTVLAGNSANAAAASVAATAPWGAAKTLAVGSGGLFGGLLGGVAGTAGSWFGTWCSAQMAPTSKEREFLLKMGRRIVAISLGFTALCFLVVRSGHRLTAWQIVAAVLTFQAIVFGYCIICWRKVQEIRRTTSPEEDPNLTPMRQRALQMTARFRGRRYRSSHTLLGLPLVDIQVSDPVIGLPTSASGVRPPRLEACGWVAIGDNAKGVIAFGHRAVGVIALGDFTLGLISFGAISAGVLTFGGLSLGLIAFGGLAAGGLAAGGLAIGWGALGGGALGVNFAFGGGAAAIHIAYGGAAYARDYAVGGAVMAAHANDVEAKAHILQHPAKLAMDWSMQNQAIWITCILVISLGVPALFNMLRYERVVEASAD